MTKYLTAFLLLFASVSLANNCNGLLSSVKAASASDTELKKIAEARVKSQALRLASYKNSSHKLKIPDDKLDLIIFVPAAAVQSVLTEGILNVHETFTSGGIPNPAARQQIDHFLLGLGVNAGAHELGSESPKLLSKSAFINISSPQKLAEMRVNPADYYGQVGIVLKPEVWNRSTWTAGDSLNLLGSPGATEVLKDQRIKFSGTGYDLSLPSESSENSYYEAQVFGPITFEDMDFLIVPKGQELDLQLPDSLSVLNYSSKLHAGRVVFEWQGAINKGPQGRLSEITRISEGSTGGRWMVDEEGVEWFMKKDVHFSELQTSAEVIASRIYGHFGYTTPDTYKYVLNGVHYSVSKSIGENHSSTDFSGLNNSEIRQMRYVAAYLKDWDRLGNPSNNRLFADGKLVVLDFGGTLGSRAQGEHKPGETFSEALGSFEATSDMGVIYDSFQVLASEDHPWSQIKKSDLKPLLEKFKKLTDEKISLIVSEAQYSIEEDIKYINRALKLRRDGIVAYLESIVD